MTLIYRGHSYQVTAASSQPEVVDRTQVRLIYRGFTIEHTPNATPLASPAQAIQNQKSVKMIYRGQTFHGAPSVQPARRPRQTASAINWRFSMPVSYSAMGA